MPDIEVAVASINIGFEDGLKVSNKLTRLFEGVSQYDGTYIIERRFNKHCSDLPARKTIQ